MCDTVNNRVEANLAAIARTQLVDLPSDRSFSYEEFAAAQSKYIKKQGETLVVRQVFP